VTRGTIHLTGIDFLKAASSLVVGAVALGFALASPSACSQPATVCQAQIGEGIVRYTVTSAASPASACANSTLPLAKNADVGTYAIGVESYPQNPTSTTTVPASIALQPEWLGARIEDAQLNAAVDPTLPASVQAAMANYPYASAAAVPQPPPQGTTADHPYAWAQFKSVTPDSAGVCQVQDMRSDLVYPDIPAHTANQQVASPLGYSANDGGIGPGQYEVASEMVPDQPATHVVYAWKNVRVYVTAGETGAQTYGDLTVTQDGCTVGYRVSILVPRVMCGTTNAAGDTVGDPTLCDPQADGPNNPNGSGINANIAPSCENIGTAANPDFECLPPLQDPLSQLQ
jgi:hypothetical protein